MIPITFDHIVRMSKEGLNTSERDVIAENVQSDYGIQGLMTLWACQDFYDSLSRPETPSTPATSWWLQDNNHYTNRVCDALRFFKFKKALTLLEEISVAPVVDDFDMWTRQNSEHLNEFVPILRHTYSYASAATVRAMAQRFFPEHPALGYPQCSIYLRVLNAEQIKDDVDEFYPVHTDTLEAFKDDAAALQYFLRVHTGLTVTRKHATAEILKIIEATDLEWSLYDGMGLDPVEAYTVSKERISFLFFNGLIHTRNAGYRSAARGCYRKK